MTALPAGEPTDAAGRLRLHRWFDRAIVAVAITALASGFGQFGVVAALGDVSTQLGHVAQGGSIADKVGLSGTSIGVGLAIIRIASLGSLPLIGIADRFGRRRVILTVTVAGLTLTATGGPTVAPCGVCEPCRAIAEDRHVDVLEMDAASRTGVDDIRELTEGVRYRPVSARYKVYIIDEVHMLSKNAFNALLKTLEEPPPDVKFIFATTEIQKVPVTVLSRCQRFSLRRVPAELAGRALSPRSRGRRRRRRASGDRR